MRTWNNAKGEGHLFSVDFIDESGEIRGTAFNAVADKFFDVLQIGQVYRVKGGQLKPANARFSNIKNSFEISFNDSTEITPVEDAGVAVPLQNFHFTPLASLKDSDVTKNYDIIAVITDVGVLGSITKKADNSEVSKRELTLLDESGASIRCTIWDKSAENFESDGGQAGCIIVVKNARVSEYNGRSLSASSNSRMLLNPDLPQSHKLMNWYAASGKDMPVQSLTGSGGGNMRDARICISQIKDERLGQDDKAAFFTLKATVMFIRKDNALYKACPTDNCNKKVIEDGNGMYNCEKCKKETDKFKWRALISFAVGDATGQTWLSGFQEVAEALLGRTAEELGPMSTTDMVQFDQVLQNATFKTHLFKCRAKMEHYQDEQRVKVSCLSVMPVDFVKECDFLIAEIKKL
eukprot:m.573309 g.573309  ORF g.573309 m.573309 type:complete len:407 (+) comp57876_c0_seq1:761-1981(+)